MIIYSYTITCDQPECDVETKTEKGFEYHFDMDLARPQLPYNWIAISDAGWRVYCPKHTFKVREVTREKAG